MALPTLPGRSYPHGASRTHAPWPVWGMQLFPMQLPLLFSILNLRQLFCISLWTSDTSPHASNYRVTHEILQAMLEVPHWVCKERNSISFPFHFVEDSHTNSPNRTLHRSSLLLIWPFFKNIFNVKDRAKSLWTRIRHLLYNYTLHFCQHLMLVCSIDGWCWVSLNQDFNINLLL